MQSPFAMGTDPREQWARRRPSALFHCSKTPAQMQIQACPRADPAQHERDADLSLPAQGWTPRSVLWDPLTHVSDSHEG